MQNHFPFTKGLNGPNTITVEGGLPDQKDELETYVQDTKLTDEAMAYLQQELLKIKRPTIAVFWEIICLRSAPGSIPQPAGIRSQD